MKTVLITGANGFLGKKIVNFFKKNRFKLILIDNQKIKKGKTIDTFICDFTNEKDRELKFLESKKKFKEKKDLQSKTKNDLSFTDELDKLAKLREKNLLTEEEYRKAKRKIFKSFEN